MMHENAQVNQYGAECISWLLPLTSLHSTRYLNQRPPATSPDWGSFHEKEPPGPCHRPANPWNVNRNAGDGSVPKNTQVKCYRSKPVHQ